MKKKKKWKGILITLVVLALLGGGGYMGVKRYMAGREKSVDVFAVRDLNGADWLSYYSDTTSSGTVVSDVSQNIYVPENKVVNEVYVNEGDEVKVGDKLLSYDTTLLELDRELQDLELQELDLELESAQADLKKLQNTTPVAYKPEEDEGYLDPGDFTLPDSFEDEDDEGGEEARMVSGDRVMMASQDGKSEPAQTEGTAPAAENTVPAADTENAAPPADTGSTEPAANTENTAPAADTGNTEPAANTENTAPSADTGNTEPASGTGNTDQAADTQPETSVGADAQQGDQTQGTGDTQSEGQTQGAADGTDGQQESQAQETTSTESGTQQGSGETSADEEEQIIGDDPVPSEPWDLDDLDDFFGGQGSGPEDGNQPKMNQSLLLLLSHIRVKEKTADEGEDALLADTRKEADTGVQETAKFTGAQISLVPHFAETPDAHFERLNTYTMRIKGITLKEEKAGKLYGIARINGEDYPEVGGYTMIQDPEDDDVVFLTLAFHDGLNEQHEIYAELEDMYAEIPLSVDEIVGGELTFRTKKKENDIHITVEKPETDSADPIADGSSPADPGADAKPDDGQESGAPQSDPSVNPGDGTDGSIADGQGNTDESNAGDQGSMDESNAGDQGNTDESNAEGQGNTDESNAGDQGNTDESNAEGQGSTDESNADGQGSTDESNAENQGNTDESSAGDQGSTDESNADGQGSTDEDDWGDQGDPAQTEPQTEPESETETEAPTEPEQVVAATSQILFDITWYHGTNEENLWPRSLSIDFYDMEDTAQENLLWSAVVPKEDAPEEGPEMDTEAGTEDPSGDETPEAGSTYIPETPEDGEAGTDGDGADAAGDGGSENGEDTGTDFDLGIVPEMDYAVEGEIQHVIDSAENTYASTHLRATRNWDTSLGEPDLYRVVVRAADSLDYIPSVEWGAADEQGVRPCTITMKYLEPQESPLVKLEPFSELTYKTGAKGMYYKGSGTKDDPYVFFCTDGVIIRNTFVNWVLGFDADGLVREREGCYVRLEIRESDTITGAFIRGVDLDGTIRMDYGYGPGTYWVFSSDSGITRYEEDIPDPEEDWDDIEDPGWQDWGETYTAEELAQAIKDKEREIRRLNLDIKEGEMKLRQYDRDLDASVVVSSVDGYVKSLGGTNGEAYMVVTNEGGLYLRTSVSELDLDSVKVGDTLTVTSWESGDFTADITEISTYPSSSDEFYSYGGGQNPNSSNYPVLARIEDTSGLSPYEYVQVKFKQPQTASNSVYITVMYVRSENGQSYVYKVDENNLLKKQYVRTGRTIDGYLEIKEGLTNEDYIAFPYGKAVKDGAKTKSAYEDEGEEF